jgi:hypothetical protein
MIRFFYFSVASVLAAICVEQALAQPVSLSPDVVEAASTPRYRTPAANNVQNLPTPTPTAAERVSSKDCRSTIPTVVGAPMMAPRKNVSVSSNADGSTSISQSMSDSGSGMELGNQTVNCGGH